MLASIVTIALTAIPSVDSINNGLGIKPPMGWRSWNAYGSHVTQTLVEECVDALLDKSRSVNGVATSLFDIGYNRVGIDDGWQQCNSTDSEGRANGNYFHNDTAPNGWAILNNVTFSDLGSMVNYAHSKNVKVDWYMNNCICKEFNPYPANEVNDVLFLRRYDLDGVKLDGCGTSHNISNWQRLINKTGRPLMVENDHNLPNYATTPDGWCDMNFFRSGGDISANFVDIIGKNLASTMKYNSQYPTGFISRPGCWAYPDMLVVGLIKQQYNATVSDMDQTHFSAWCVVSSPLILDFDLTNNDTMNAVWDIITNPETIAVAQTWAGMCVRLHHD